MTMSREIDVRSHNAVSVMRAKEQRPQKRLSECDNVQCSERSRDRDHRRGSDVGSESV